MAKEKVMNKYEWVPALIKLAEQVTDAVKSAACHICSDCKKK